MVEENWPPMQAVEFDPFADEANSATSLPLTATQRELFAAVQMGPHAHCAFNLSYVLYLRGALSMASMQSALQQVVDRHAALRLSIAADGSVQEIVGSTAVSLPLLELDALTPEEREQALAEIVEHETHTPFDLQAAGLWRARVLRLEPNRFALVFTVHHLASDGWSSSVLFGDLAKAYAADRFGMQADLPEALPYEAYVQQQSAPQGLSDEQRARAYWLERHTPPAAPLALPLDHPRPAFKTFACGYASLPVDAELTGAVRQMGARLGCTLFVTLLAVYQGLLARLAGSIDVVVGVPMANQTLLDNGHVIAHGANTVPLRATVDLERPFSEILPAVREGFLDAQSHQHLSFGNLVHALKLPRDPSRTPLVDVLFNIDRTGAPFDFGELRLERIDTPKAFSNSEISTNVIDNGRELLVECHYNLALFDDATVQRWLSTFREALRRLAMQPSLSLVQALAPTADECALVDCFNDTRVDYADSVRLEVQFSRMAAETPHAPALWCADRCISYAQLDAMSNGVAQSLMSAGLAVGDRVGLYCGRSELMVAGVLGVLKAGAAYVPLDPAYPGERLSMMTADAQLRVVLCDAETEAGWAYGDVRLLRLDRCPSEARATSVTHDASQAAYVIYTSGSTGRPKGVVIAHRSVMNFVSSVARRPGMRREDRLAAVATLSFDMSVLDLFLPLTAGASVVLIPRNEVQDGALLRDRVQYAGATLMQAAPSIWRLLLDAGWTAREGFRAFVGGEALPPDLARTLLERGAEVWNFYGPTETTVYSTCWRVPAQHEGIRVGRPVANTQIHVLDEHQRALPLGAVGEICIAGDGVALGYHARPDLTAERFVTDPAQAGGRMYRTGDLGRWHADGELECLGRIDQQIKLRGYRIELGEIESALMQVPGVERALAMLREDVPGDARLVGYAVLTEGASSAPTDLRGWREALRRTLPDYMLPSHVVTLAVLPQLPNGKIDRQSLPTPGIEIPGQPRSSGPSELTGSRSTDLPALSAAEEQVAAVWRRLLQIAVVLPTDNFFDLGGHSLLAARASHEIEVALGFKVGVPRLVMETLAQIAMAPPADAVPAEVNLTSRSGWLKRLAEGLRRV